MNFSKLFFILDLFGFGMIVDIPASYSFRSQIPKIFKRVFVEYFTSNHYGRV